MKAIFSDHYCQPKELKVGDLDLPQIEQNQVLVRIKNTAINDWDWGMVRGKPRIYRLIFGLFKPKYPIPGMELSGIVEKLGFGATKFNVGDEVFGDTSDHGFGTFAEYISIHEDTLMKKPAELPHIEATAIPHAAMLAYQALFRIGKLENGMKILVNGAGGGVGNFAIQLAKLFDTHVTGIDHEKKLHGMKELGYDRVIDYNKVDFTKEKIHYDLILDTKTSRSPFSHANVLKNNGLYVTVGGSTMNLIGHVVFGKIAGRKGNKSLRILPLKPMQGMNEFMRMYKENNFKCLIDGPHPFIKIPELISYFGEGKHIGKIVVTVSES